MAGVKLGDAYDLEDLALETGSSIDYADGSKFNSGGEVAKRRAPKLAPVPEVEDEDEDEDETPEPPNPEMMALLKQLVAVVSRPVEVRLPPMPAAQVVVKEAPEPAQAKAWEFEFERNANGTIKRINAKAKG